MVKIDFQIPTDGKLHRFCLSCQSDGVERVERNGKTRYWCPTCNKTADASIYFYKQVVWIDKAKELWHESAGVFVRNPEGKFLFYERTEYPFVFTIPCGHVGIGEDPEVAAKRELKEETGLVADRLQEVVRHEDIIGDSCSGAADNHRWHAFLALTNHHKVTIVDEGERPVWLRLDEALKKELTLPTRRIIERYAKQLEAHTEQ